MAKFCLSCLESFLRRVLVHKKEHQFVELGLGSVINWCFRTLYGCDSIVYLPLMIIQEINFFSLDTSGTGLISSSFSLRN